MEKTLIALTVLDWLILPVFLLLTGDEYTVRALAGFLVIPYIVHLFYIPKTFSSLVALENLLVILYFKKSINDIFLKKDRTFVIEAMDLYTTGVVVYVVIIWLLGMVQHLRCQSIIETQKKIASNLLESNNKLKEIVKELNESKAQLEEALKAKDYLLAGVSHELRNPLNSLLGNIELLSLEAKEPKHQEMLGISKLCGEILLAQINNLLDAGKMMSHIEISPSETDLYELIEKVWKLHAFKFKQMTLKVELIISKQLPHHILIDSHRVIQILFNLLSNSVKFTEKGTIQWFVDWYSETKSNLSQILEPQPFYKELHVHKFVSEISSNQYPINDALEEDSNSDEDVMYENNRNGLEYKYNKPIKQMSTILADKYHVFTVEEQNISEKLIKFENKQKNKMDLKKGILRFEVIDTGCGIAKESQSKLFKPFVQEDSSVTRKYGGTGLGLFIIKSILSKMGGKIALHSMKHVGTDIIVTIPSEIYQMKVKRTISAKSEHESSDCSSMKPHFQKGDHNVMIVDDNPFNLLILSQYLEKNGLMVTDCSSGKDALKKFSSVHPRYFSFITLDIQMPDMDGITLARLIRKFEKSENRPEVPIVFVSGNCVEEERQACLDPKGEIRAASFIRKPITFQNCKEFAEVFLRSHKSVLVFNDDPFSIQLLSVIFTKMGIETTVCHSSLEGLKLLKENNYNFRVILLDCEILLMDGATTTQEVQKWIKSANIQNIPIVGFTGNNDSTQTKAFAEAGIRRIFHKPLNFSLLTEYVKKLMEL
jgi:signal transduction histidine kinase/CheY-like chemotaxis protein